jgi:hypothetical protein
MRDVDAGPASTFYSRYRIADQQRFYEARRSEYERADRQLAAVTTVLLLLAATAGVLGTAEVWLGRAWWGVVAAACSALAATATSWGTLVGFAENARLYRSADVALDPLRGPLEGRPDDRRTLLRVVVRAEEILQAETSQWGQHLQGSATTLQPPESRGRGPLDVDGDGDVQVDVRQPRTAGPHRADPDG